MFKKLLSLVLAVAAVFTLCTVLASCGGGNGDDTTDGGNTPTGNTLKVGAIMIGDETEGYTLAHMNGMDAAVAALKAQGINVEVMYKTMIPESDAVKTNAESLISSGCSLIVTNSYGHQNFIADVVKDHPDVTFVAMTGDLAKASGYENYHNAFTNIYESRYVSGVIAGMKLKELIENGTLTKETLPSAFDTDGKIKIGYVGAFPYAEVVSGYTAFFLGIQSIVPDVAMTVKYTTSWFSQERESEVAKFLMSEGCVIIGQHADSTGAPTAVQTEYEESEKVCFSVGYNVDMLSVAEDVALTSSTNNWEVYYEYLFKTMAEGGKLATEWSKGYDVNAVGTTTLGSACAAGTAEKVAEVVAAIKDGSLKVFDCSKFTVNGAHITTSKYSKFGDANYWMNGQECIVKEGDVTYFAESTFRAAPYFELRIDGITEIESDYQE